FDERAFVATIARWLPAAQRLYITAQLSVHHQHELREKGGAEPQTGEPAEKHARERAGDGKLRQPEPRFSEQAGLRGVQEAEDVLRGEDQKAQDEREPATGQMDEVADLVRADRLFTGDRNSDREAGNERSRPRQDPLHRQAVHGDEPIEPPDEEE